jgi:hypothetical protein
MDRPWRILKERLINKITVLVYPGIDGLAGVPSIFEFVGEANPRPAADQSPRHVARKH